VSADDVLRRAAAALETEQGDNPLHWRIRAVAWLLDRADAQPAEDNDDELLMACDSLLSLIRHRERTGLSEQTIRDLDALGPRLRTRTDRR
jgi:hypothetical protein